MRTTQVVRTVCVGLCLAVTVPIVGFGQRQDPARQSGGPLTGPPVLDAPFWADAITTVRLTLPDGSRLEQSTTARYYRDRTGRGRVELMMDGLKAPSTTAERHIRTIVSPAPDGKTVMTLDPETRTARYQARYFAAFAAGGENRFAVPIGGVQFLIVRRARDLFRDEAGSSAGDLVRDESLGTRRIEDVDTIGRRITMTVPAGRSRNDRPIEMVDERWESPELQLVIAAHSSDSRTGEVEYRLTNIRRVQPPADLFVIPPDYTIDTTSTQREPWLTLTPLESYPGISARDGRAR